MPRPPPSNGLGPASRPSSASELAEEAGNYVYNPTVPLRHWVGAAETLYREGSIYRREGNLAKAYMLLHRFSSLYLNNLAKHPLAKTPEGKKMLKTLQRRLPSVIGQLEEMKPQIDEAHHEWQRMSEAERKEVQDFSSEKSPEYAAHASRDPALAWSNRARAKVLDAGENQELAVDLATKEFRRRKAERYTGAWEQEDEERNGRHQVDRDWTYTREVPTGDDDLQRQMELARRRLDHPDEVEQYTPIRPTQQLTLRSSSYNYPTISKSSPLHYDPSQSERLRDEVGPQPPRPPKEFVSRNESLNRSYAPLVPRKELDQSTMPPSDQEMFSPPPPAVPDKTPNTDQPKKKERYTFKPADYLENGDPLRPVFLPEGLRREFVQLAADKTRQGIEMCGLLCGTIVNNALFVTCLLIPEQKGTPDTCETINESSYFDFMDKEDLVQLGWIHTHPTQTCFMSSRDLHTHAGYQIMTPESIAIVCAPRYEPSWGVFRLTNPPGLNHLLQCSKTDTFHQHDIDSNLLYKDASHPPGHVYISKRLDYYVHDLRPEA